MNKPVKQTWLWKYWDAIRRGEVLVGRELRVELEALLAELEEDRYDYDTRVADFRILFMEGCIRLTKSPFYGQPMKLMLWQKALIEVIYSYKMADTGLDRFQRIILLIGRKNGKSEVCSGLGLTEFMVGPQGADIVCSSNDDSQANIIYEAINTMRLMIDPKSRDTWKNQTCIRNKATNSKIFKLSDRTRNKEGRNIDFAVVDEVHEMKENVIVKAIEQSQSLKPNPKLILITTEGFVNGGFLDEELQKCRKILAGELEGPAAERTLPWLYTQDSEQEVWQDRNSWQKSNPTLGVVKRWDYLDIQVDLARQSRADRAFVLSKDFNIKQTTSQAWLMQEDYTYPATYDLETFRGYYALGAVDLAETTDLTAAKVLLMRPDDPVKYVLSRYFIPESKLTASDDRGAGAKYSDWAAAGLLTVIPGNDVDQEVVADWFYSLYEEYDIRLVRYGYDQKFAKQFIKRMDQYGFEGEMVVQSKFVLNSPLRLVEADLKSRLINYNENPIDRWCLSNASLQIDSMGFALAVKINNQKARRIDGAVCLIILYEMFRRYRTEFKELTEGMRDEFPA